MKSETIAFRTPRVFLGRNGVMKMGGIRIEPQGDDLCLAPLTSRLRLGRAYLHVPAEMAAAVANALLRLSVAGEAGKPKVVIGVRGGVAEVASCPPGIEVEIVDYDNQEAEAA